MLKKSCKNNNLFRDYQPACDERGILLILYNNQHKANLLPLTVDYVAAHAFAGSRRL